MTQTSRRRLVILILVVAGAGLAWMALDVWAGRRADREYARLEKRFGSLDGRSVVARPVAAGDNRARFVRAATDLAVRGGRDQGYAALLASFKRFETLPASAPTPDDLRTFLDANGDAMRLADAARSRHQSSWDADYGGGANQPRWLNVQTLANSMYLAALLDIREGRPDAAARTLEGGLAVSASFAQEPVFIGQVIRIAVATQQCEGVQRLIARSEPSKTVLEDLARALAENRATDPMYVGILAELRTGDTWFKRTERGQPTDTPWYSNASGVRGPLAVLARPFLRLGRARFLLDMEHLLDVETARRPRPAVADPHLRFWDLRRLSESYWRGLARAMDSGDQFHGVLAVTEIGVALRRYRLERGGYPDALSALVPAYVSRLPIDPVTGAPPVYSRRGAGFSLKAEALRKDWTLNGTLQWTVAR